MASIKKNPTKEEQEEIMDFIVCQGAMFSHSFLQKYSKQLLKDPKRSLEDFHNEWLKTISDNPTGAIPFGPGATLGYLFVGIAYAKEKWFDIIPDIDPALDTRWGLDKISISTPNETKPITVKYIVRRIRNSLDHGNFTIKYGNMLTDTFLDGITIHFHDNTMSKDNPFDMDCTLRQVLTISQEFNKMVFDDLESRGIIT